jgi:hypothetical protein
MAQHGERDKNIPFRQDREDDPLGPRSRKEKGKSHRSVRRTVTGAESPSERVRPLPPHSDPLIFIHDKWHQRGQEPSTPSRYHVRQLGLADFASPSHLLLLHHKAVVLRQAEQEIRECDRVEPVGESSGVGVCGDLLGVPQGNEVLAPRFGPLKDCHCCAFTAGEILECLVWDVRSA